MTGGVTCAADDGTGGLLRGPAHLDRAAREEGKRPPEGGSVGRRSVRSSPRTTQIARGRFTAVSCRANGRGAWDRGGSAGGGGRRAVCAWQQGQRAGGGDGGRAGAVGGRAGGAEGEGRAARGRAELRARGGVDVSAAGGGGRRLGVGDRRRGRHHVHQRGGRVAAGAR